MPLRRVASSNVLMADLPLGATGGFRAASVRRLPAGDRTHHVTNQCPRAKTHRLLETPFFQPPKHALQLQPTNDVAVSPHFLRKTTHDFPREKSPTLRALAAIPSTFQSIDLTSC